MRKGGNADPHSDSIRRHSFRSGGGFLRSRKSNPFRSGVALRLRRARGADPSSAGQDSRRKGLKHEALPSGGGSNLRDAKQARCMTHQGCPRNGTATIEELSTLISQLCSELADAKTSANTRLSRLNAAARNAIHRADEACALRETVAAQRAEIAELRRQLAEQTQHAASQSASLATRDEGHGNDLSRSATCAGRPQGGVEQSTRESTEHNDADAGWDPEETGSISRCATPGACRPARRWGCSDARACGSSVIESDASSAEFDPDVNPAPRPPHSFSISGSALTAARSRRDCGRR